MISQRLAQNQLKAVNLKAEPVKEEKADDTKQDLDSSSSSINLVENGTAGRKPNFKKDEDEEKNKRKTFKFKR